MDNEIKKLKLSFWGGARTVTGSNFISNMTRQVLMRFLLPILTLIILEEFQSLLKMDLTV